MAEHRTLDRLDRHGEALLLRAAVQSDIQRRVRLHYEIVGKTPPPAV
jgi:hypothetical protein